MAYTNLLTVLNLGAGPSLHFPFFFLFSFFLFPSFFSSFFLPSTVRVSPPFCDRPGATPPFKTNFKKKKKTKIKNF